ncbi:DUF350 domain-containing protein [Flexibacterium corallicola]|uniref:DUF350 domain-containing protein n=1 Tax=Flexibacterium corallicola TaxID=3037259 RepID=UPI00286F3616|nr:DUF350 domain-containing protein [Pseudovibrio sp. M1P-2-3]
MTDLQGSLMGVIPFLAYFASALILLFGFCIIYTRITPHREMALIKQNNISAALSFSGAMLGFSLPIASAAANSVDLVDFLVWGVIAGIVQIITYLVFRLFYPKVSQRIEDGEIAIGIHLATVSLAVGWLNAASMTY